MRTWNKKPAFGCLGIIAASALAVSFAQGGNNPEDEAAIRKLLEAGLKAYNQHDARAWSMIFHSDADLTNVIGWTLHGREEIETYFQRLFAKERHPKLPSFSQALVEADGEPKIRFHRPDVATVHLRWTMTGAIGPDDKAMPKREMVVTLVATKENGVWGIASYHNVDRRTDQPKEIPAELLKRP
jgi:uncharacterized protein (TIGR02246 family)